MIIGSAMDIVTHCGVPRYLHNNLPLGNPLGPPDDRETQRTSVVRALELVRDARSPVVESTRASWPGDADWTSVYARVDDSNRENLKRMGEENRRKRAADKAKGLRR